MTVKLDNKERAIKINMDVLEKFEDITGADAFQFNFRSAKQIRVMLELALKAGDPAYDLSTEQLKKVIVLSDVIDPLAKAFVKATVGDKAGE